MAKGPCPICGRDAGFHDPLMHYGRKIYGKTVDDVVSPLLNDVDEAVVRDSYEKETDYQ